MSVIVVAVICVDDYFIGFGNCGDVCPRCSLAGSFAPVN